ncbi:nucleotidyltransferase family protein [Nocardia acidivorans]|uniref:nucleotidyltransferase family protein n=1 Tax=Nocardia acidivorans TaxID=404580 RepID=UPI00082A9382|nr:nucleotidyltransferase family protein [Nocardia acidivorans]
MTPERCDGLVLAAGAGTRYGMPKALAEDGVWLRTAVHALRAGGCARVFVVLGATGPALPDRDSDSAPRWLVSQTPRIEIPAGAHPVWASEWATGLSASLRAGLAAVASHELAARITAERNIAPGISRARNSRDGITVELPGYVAIMPVDTPDVGPEVVRRVIDAARASESGLARAYFGNVPGHPVLLGRAHWAEVMANASGNYGAGTYLRGRTDMVCVTCDDLATGIDRDYPCGTR